VCRGGHQGINNRYQSFNVQRTAAVNPGNCPFYVSSEERGQSLISQGQGQVYVRTCCGRGRTYLGDCGIQLAAVDKLCIRQLLVVVLVQSLEEFVHSLHYRLPPKSFRQYTSWLWKHAWSDRTFSGVFSSVGSWVVGPTSL